MEGCHRLGTRDWYLMHYSNPAVTGGQKHTHTHLPHSLVVCCCLPLWLCGHQCSLASHCPPLMLPFLVDCCFSPLPWIGGVWGHHLPLLFSRFVQLPLIGAAKLWPPQRLSLHLRAVNLRHHLQEGHVQLVQHQGRVGGQRQLCAVWPWQDTIYHHDYDNLNC